MGDSILKAIFKKFGPIIMLGVIISVILSYFTETSLQIDEANVSKIIIDGFTLLGIYVVFYLLISLVVSSVSILVTGKFQTNTYITDFIDRLSDIISIVAVWYFVMNADELARRAGVAGLIALVVINLIQPLWRNVTFKTKEK